ncbi:hypothetical protein [Brumicola nitratireducens]|uniref:Uncharacterized protein n=1 Tax=Glaciecola nitratireducens (strain JCM 12485 / KCTC 12276 / FR1064) TaxID=1085623 RepID=G4QL31_GLANF|nr:hypothetical protein [Glaciecola nitratireducens]AEP29421.1 hypothetical protein GNIT_1297 [Glaciecola nitratireducens FR1064]
MNYEQLAQSIMTQYAIDTGLARDPESGAKNPPRRYLWTDAFAVCNYLGFYKRHSAPAFLQQALTLVEQVHCVLGKHREDSSKKGWISGLDDVEAKRHPTAGGLRIGKPLNESNADTEVNSSAEWQQDGQYFHYLTKWMHALNCVARATGDMQYNEWARELAKTAHSAFVYDDYVNSKRVKRIYWKMSIDLSRPLVLSMGHHDPLDGLLIYQQLQTCCARAEAKTSNYNLSNEIAEMAAVCEAKNWATNDTLGVGCLLTDAYKLCQLMGLYQLNGQHLFEKILQDIESSLHHIVGGNLFSIKASNRLAFRELGLAIGLQTISKMRQVLTKHSAEFQQVDSLNLLLLRLSAYEPLHSIIENFWLKPEQQSLAVWQEHADINNVMLATSLFPSGYVQL